MCMQVVYMNIPFIKVSRHTRFRVRDQGVELSGQTSYIARNAHLLTDNS